MPTIVLDTVRSLADVIEQLSIGGDSPDESRAQVTKKIGVHGTSSDNMIEVLTSRELDAVAPASLSYPGCR